MRVDLTPAARADLKEIALYIARDSPAAAKAWVRRLRLRAKAIGDAPHAGRIVPELDDPAIREVLLGAYRIVYRVHDRRVEVLAIFEGHRRLPAI